ncbi:MAG: hypothetical protein KKH12_15125 [Gammaproteobacteria bacterium]|nr:hypothetical protein [Gammaproteobacteria bacterium]MBU1482994.1 hypothetical protein [Gammaproteobacteria bacterium]
MTDKKHNRWVLVSSDRSIENGDFSLLAVAEIPFAIFIFWWLNNTYSAHWFLLSGLLAVPILLLRSPSSIEDGILLLREYHDEKFGPKTSVHSVLIFCLIFACTSYACYYMAKDLALTHTGFLLYFFAAGIAMVGVITTLAGAGVNTGLSLFAGGTVFWPMGLIWASVALFSTRTSIVVSVAGVVAYAIVVARSSLKEDCLRSEHSYLHGVGGLFIRCVGIRLISTAKHLREGLSSLPINFIENVFVIDAFHLPELLPGARKVSSEYSFRFLLAGSIHQVMSLVGPMVFLSAMIYRLNIKASIWLWGPIALALSPAVWVGKDELSQNERMRCFTAFWSTWAMQSVLWILTAYLVGWLSISFLPNALQAALPSPILMLHNFVTIPTTSMRYAMLCVVAISLLGLLVSAYRVRAAYDKELAGAGDFDRLRPELKIQLKAKATSVRRWLQWNTAAIVLTVWCFALRWGVTHWPIDIQNFVWSWTKPWL